MPRRVVQDRVAVAVHRIGLGTVRQQVGHGPRIPIPCRRLHCRWRRQHQEQRQQQAPNGTGIQGAQGANPHGAGSRWSVQGRRVMVAADDSAPQCRGAARAVPIPQTAVCGIVDHRGGVPVRHSTMTMRKMPAHAWPEPGWTRHKHRNPSLCASEPLPCHRFGGQPCLVAAVRSSSDWSCISGPSSRRPPVAVAEALPRQALHGQRRTHRRPRTTGWRA